MVLLSLEAPEALQMRNNNMFYGEIKMLILTKKGALSGAIKTFTIFNLNI